MMTSIVVQPDGAVAQSRSLSVVADRQIKRRDCLKQALIEHTRREAARRTVKQVSHAKENTDRGQHVLVTLLASWPLDTRVDHYWCSSDRLGQNAVPGSIGVAFL